MKKLLLSTVSALVLFATSDANAVRDPDAYPYWYIGLNAGITYVDDADVTGASTGTVEHDSGASFGASLGYNPHGTGSLIDYLRFEVEVRAESADLDSFGTATATNDVQSVAYMANIFADLRVYETWTPYVGAGLGFADVELDSPTLSVDDSDNALAYQFMAGVGYAPRSLPNTEFTLGYRYFATDDLEFSNNASAAVDYEYSSHNIEVGTRFKF